MTTYGLWGEALALFGSLSGMRSDRQGGIVPLERIDAARTRAWQRVKRRELAWKQSLAERSRELG